MFAHEHLLDNPELERNVRRQTIIFAVATIIQLASFFGLFHLLVMIMRAIPTVNDSEEGAVAAFFLFLTCTWLFLNLIPVAFLMSVFISRFAKRARKYQMACGITVIISAGLTLLFDLIVLTLFRPDGFSFSIAQWLIYASIFFAGMVYMASGISQLRHLSPAYTDEIYMLHVRNKLEEQMASWRIRAFESCRYSRRSRAG